MDRSNILKDTQCIEIVEYLVGRYQEGIEMGMHYPLSKRNQEYKRTHLEKDLVVLGDSSILLHMVLLDP
jgi:hypothetical protein